MIYRFLADDIFVEKNQLQEVIMLTKGERDIREKIIHRAGGSELVKVRLSSGETAEVAAINPEDLDVYISGKGNKLETIPISRVKKVL